VLVAGREEQETNLPAARFIPLGSALATVAVGAVILDKLWR
jgi:hypothetical protein